jgi:poly-beta-1,6 N-acetyl-D-glucosamine synthase
MLLVQGFSWHTIGAAGTGGGNVSKAPLAGQRSILAATPRGLGSIGPRPGKRVALTFDDGPGPWTLRIAEVLHRNRVPATFFLIGSEAARYPDIVRRLYADGFGLGNHTFTHVDLANVPAWEARLQVSATDNIIAGIVGVRPRLLRPPYSSMAGAVTPHELSTYSMLAHRGYVIALSDLNSEDWTRPGVDTIVRNATPRGNQGGVIMMHDGGGNRSETLAAVKRLIPLLRDRGFTFTRLDQLAGLPRSSLELPATSSQQLRGQMLLTTLAAARLTTKILTIIVLIVGALTAFRMLAVLGLACYHGRRRRRTFDPEFTPPVSVIVPAFNEELNIASAVRSLAQSDYPTLEVIVIDDGSTDRTAAEVAGLALDRVRLIRQANRGKAAALNLGVSKARYDVIAMVDADTAFEPDAMRHLVQSFRDPRVGAVSGNTKVANRSGLLGRWQHIEYVMGFNLDRRMYELLDCTPTVPGAIGAYRREALEAVGGISGATLAEDTDVTMALGCAGWRVAYAPDAIAWTEAPSTLRGLWRQRFRWAYGTLQCVWKHKKAIWAPRRSAVGRRAIPYMAVFQLALPMAAPLVDLFAVFGLLFLDPVPVALYWLAFNALQMILALVAFRLDRESPRVLWALPLQQLVYRQLMYLVVLESAVTALKGLRVGWTRAPRTGEVAVDV